MSGTDQMTRVQLRRWAEELVDLTRRNRLLYFKHTASASLGFRQDGFAVSAGLDRKGWGFFLPPQPPEAGAEGSESYDPGSAAPDQLVVDMNPPRYKPQIERGLKNLHRKAQAEFLDAGLWVLYLGLGELRWQEVDGKKATSPLLLVPVELTETGPSKEFRLQRSDNGEAALNPALGVKLEKDFGVELPTLDQLEEPDLRHVIDAISNAISDSAWNVTSAAVLTTFTFQKEVIYRDLRDNEDEIVEHPMIRLLAEGPSSDVAADLAFEPTPEARMDQAHPPEELACVLDADATQRQCLIAARDGRSFVMDGPPGTGKSQTITNVIAQLLADGKTVLFVSEKAAALEVVENRLAELRLDPFVLALHSRTATRKAVAHELGRALEERPRATERFDPADRARLAADRQRLSAYAHAVNRRRSPLERSLHDVVGRIAQLDRLAEVPIPPVDTLQLRPQNFAELVDVAHRLGRAWGPVARGDDFLWRDLEDPRAGAARDADIRRRLRSCTASLTAVEATVQNVCQELGVPNSYGPETAAELVDVLDIVARRFAVDHSVLSVENDVPVIDDLRRLAGALRAEAGLEQQLEVLSAQWRDVDASAASRFGECEEALASAEPTLELNDALRAKDLSEIAQSLVVASTVLEDLRGPLSVLREAFRVRANPTPAVAERLAHLGRLAGSPTPPEPTWLNPVFKDAVAEARQVLADLLGTYRARRDALATIYTGGVLELDLQGLRTRLVEVHTGIRKLSAAYRQDKRTLAGVTVAGKVTREAIDKLDEALEWKQLSERLSQAEGRHAATLGTRYWGERQHVDLDDVERAVTLADEALRLAGGEVDPSDLAKQIGLGGSPDPRLPQACDAVLEMLAQLEATWTFREFSGAGDLRDLPLDGLAGWLEETADAVAAVAQQCEDVSDSVHTPLGLRSARTLARRRAGYDTVSADVHAQREALRSLLGEQVDRIVNGDDAEAVANWVIEIREAFGGRLRQRTAIAVLRTTLTSEDLRDGITQLMKDVDALFGEFDESYGDELADELLRSFDGGHALLDQLAATVGDIGEWEAFSSARAHLAEAGWEAVVAECVGRAVDGDQVGPLVERALLQRWVDQVLDNDPTIEPRRAVDRDTLRDEFRKLDAEMTADAAARVINACSGRRPRSLAGQAGIINQQAQLKRRHKPVRRLLDEAGEVAQRLKPCFMMSPLSVSQFLPPGLRFDVVIFDEASQVRESDAVCCVYRGDQLIVTGDPKQLPPTSFFDRVMDTEEEDLDEELLDFESVLDRCKAQGFPLLPLNWHYRSQHESLITFSNRSFYDGRLHTFPGAVFESPDLGVELFVVKGVYERGGTRDNPIEAEAVVDRVLHHRREHPDLSLGVVALSSAQQSAIEAAIERRSSTEPELRELVSDDRLSGFFVKNLENVQGDERDIIVLSVGYGPDEMGKFTMNFGPMNRPGGERRLNVAVTRARRRVEAVASFRPGQITSTTPTIVHLARYLDFADRGIAALALDLADSVGDVESPFEEEVVRSIRALGYDAVPQVGVAGYRVDIGIRHPDEPGSYLLGVECDGAAYHSAKVARDRDRLRQQVLEGLGWTIHRIWSTAWFSDREGEVERLRRRIEDLVHGRHGQADPFAVPSPVEVVVEEHDFDDYPDWMFLYVPPSVDPVESHLTFTDPAARPIIVRQVAECVAEAGPLHKAQVLEAIRDAWGIGRAGAKIREAFDRAVAQLVSNAHLETDQDFLWEPGELFVRGPAEGDLSVAM